MKGISIYEEDIDQSRRWQGKEMTLHIDSIRS